MTKKMERPKPRITVIRPILSEEERSRRMEHVKECVRNFWIAYEKAKEGGNENA